MCNDCEKRGWCKGREFCEALGESGIKHGCDGYKKDISEEEQYKRLRGY